MWHEFGTLAKNTLIPSRSVPRRWQSWVVQHPKLGIKCRVLLTTNNSVRTSNLDGRFIVIEGTKISVTVVFAWFFLDLSRPASKESFGMLIQSVMQYFRA